MSKSIPTVFPHFSFLFLQIIVQTVPVFRYNWIFKRNFFFTFYGFRIFLTSVKIHIICVRYTFKNVWVFKNVSKRPQLFKNTYNSTLSVAFFFFQYFFDLNGHFVLKPSRPNLNVLIRTINTTGKHIALLLGRKIRAWMWVIEFVNVATVMAVPRFFPNLCFGTTGYSLNHGEFFILSDLKWSVSFFHQKIVCSDTTFCIYWFEKRYLNEYYYYVIRLIS